MTASATDQRYATEAQVRFLDSLYDERVPFGYDPNQVYSVQEASRLITAGKAADRKPKPGQVSAAPGYYVLDLPGECEGHPSTSGPIGNVVECDGRCKPTRTVFVVVASKRNPGRTYAKQLVISERTQRASWSFIPGGVQHLVNMVPLSVEEAAKLGKKHGICVVCARTLTDDTNKGSDGLTSIQRGIGPVCMKNEGLAR